MPWKNVIWEKLSHNRIGLLTINRPDYLNALNKETMLEIKDVIFEVEKDPYIDVLIITGKGMRAFVAGADIEYMSGLSAVEGRNFSILGQEIFRMLEVLEKPVIAAINGFALGAGCEIALACDFRIASSNAKIGLPEVGLGIIPGFGGTQRLPRLVGPGVAKQMMYTAEMIDAEEALRIKLVNQVVEPEELMDTVTGIAQRISDQNQLAVRFCKLATNEGIQTSIDKGMSIESHLFGRCFTGQNHKVAMSKFLHRKKKSPKNK